MNIQLTKFYRGETPDIAGRKIDQIWAFDYTELESVHDYIQWLFPSAKASQFNASAPLLDAETIAAFHTDLELKEHLDKSLDVMLGFYGLQMINGFGGPIVRKGKNYEERKATWQDAPAGYLNHNLLRLTRIIEALNVLGRPKKAAALCKCLEQIQQEEPAKIPAKTLHFWKVAAGVE